MANKKVMVAGATGLVGNAALRHFGSAGGAEVVALSRRKRRGELHVPVEGVVGAGERRIPGKRAEHVQALRPVVST